MSGSSARFLSGQTVEVRSAAEILATLDRDGACEGLPFMPEMAAYCGRRMTVHRRADKTCVEGFGLRTLGDAVLLKEARCDGGAHDGCERGCLMFWREAWLKPAGEGAAVASAPVAGDLALRRLQRTPTRRDGLYHCQSTALASITGPLSRWNYRHLVDDVRRGELTVAGFAGMVWRTIANKARALAGLPELLALSGPGTVQDKGDLGLQPGERVRIKSAEAVSATLTADGRNRGLTFEPEMTRFVGREFEVDYPVRRIILEESGRMVRLSNTVALKDVICEGVCTKNCPRANPLFWREIWLERVAAAGQGAAPEAPRRTAATA